MRVRGNRLRFALAAAAVWSLASPAMAQEGGGVLLVELSDAITPVTADYLVDAVEEAESGNYQLLLVELDTPGGLDVSMRQIVQAFLGAEVPVAVYVAPQGARAASAGTMITMAAHVAAMAPGTTIGAATPVDLGGGEITDKVINDAAAYAVSIAERRGRNAEFADAAVREGRSVTGQRAAEEGVVDLVAASRNELLEALDGRTVDLGERTVTLSTAGALVERFEMGWGRELLGRIADPNLAFIFLSLGTLAIIYEIANPGMGLGGIAGVILLILAFFSLSVLPVDLVGIALVVLAAGLFIAELFVPGVGVMAAGGVIALLLSGLFLFEGGIRVSLAVLLPTVTVVGVGTLWAGRLAWRSRSAQVAIGSEAMLGKTTLVRVADGATGSAFLEGAWWTVRSMSKPLVAGARVRVVGREGLELLVEPEEEGE
jgi:membrane-bound serine protease (ClpP class)